MIHPAQSMRITRVVTCEGHSFDEQQPKRSKKQEPPDCSPPASHSTRPFTRGKNLAPVRSLCQYVQHLLECAGPFDRYIPNRRRPAYSGRGGRAAGWRG